MLGIFLHQFVIRTAEIDMVMFGRSIYPLSYVWSALLTILFGVFVNLVMYRKLKKVDMVESLDRESELRKEHWRSMLKAGSRMARFQNTHESAWSIIRQLDKCDPVPLQLQEEMVDRGLPLEKS